MNRQIVDTAATRISTDLRQQLIRIIDHCQKVPHYGPVFDKPVDYIGQGLTDYLKVVKRPMDLSQLRRNMELGEYEFLYEFLHDADLIWSNCRTYTKDSPVFNEICSYMEETFMLQLDKLEPRISNEVHKLITTQNIPHQQPETRIFSATRLQCLIKELLDLPE